MSLPVAVSLVGVSLVGALTLGVPVLNPPSPVDVVPVLTSTPFGAGPGHRVTHTIALSGSGTGTASAVRVTFTTTVDLDGVTASARPGRCTATARTVVCDLGDLRFPDATTPTVTITGTVHSPTPPSALVENKVAVHLGQSTAADHIVSNAYLVASPSPGTGVRSTDPARASGSSRWSGGWTTAVVGVLGVVLVVGGALLFQRLRRRRS